jgi:hypothetical protein
VIEKKTVLILGAGASVPYGFPTGAELRRDILASLGNEGRFQNYHALGYTERHWLENFRRDFWRSQQPSIDAFLESRPDHLELGQLVIADFLMPNERRYDLHPEDWRTEGDYQLLGINVKLGPDEHWYRYLFQRMGPTKEQFTFLRPSKVPMD